MKQQFIAATLAMVLSAAGMKAQTQSLLGEYWFDQNTQRQTFVPGSFLLDVTDLSEGLHTINAQVTYGNGVRSTIASAWFVRMPQFAEGMNCDVCTFIDGKPDKVIQGRVSSGSMALDLDMSGVSPGLHSLGAQLRTANGELSSIVSAWFMRMPSFREGTEMNVCTYIDGKPDKVYKAKVSGGNLPLNLDVTGHSLGVHSLGVQVVSENGIVSAYKESLFMRVPTTDEKSTLRAYYLLDGIVAPEPISSPLNGNTCHLDLDVASLNSGIHSVSMYLASPLGIASDIRTSWFVKIPNGGEGVVAYEYWLNDNPETLRRVTLEKITNPCSLISLLDMPVEPFCSSRYRFVIEDGNPAVYGCNSFQIRFTDPDGRFTMANGEYADTRVRTELTDIPAITPNQGTVLDRIAENEIRWYSFSGQIGDSIGVRLDSPAMVELYGPDGSTILKRDKSKARDYASKILDSNGTYYLAVHDQTGIGSVKVYFDQIPKFALSPSAPDHSADDCKYFMDIIGNSFHNLVKVELQNGSSTLTANIGEIYNKFKGTVSFELPKDAELGDYTLVGTFRDDEDNTIHKTTFEKALTIEKYVEGDITVEVIPSLRSGIPYEVGIRITNNSNRGCWGIPVNLAVENPGGECVWSFKDFYLYSPEGVDHTVYPKYLFSDNLLATGQNGVMVPFIMPYLGPGECRMLTIGLTTQDRSTVKMYAWADKPWSTEFAKIINGEYSLKEMLEYVKTNIISAKTLAYLTAVINQHGITDMEQLIEDIKKLAKLAEDELLSIYMKNDSDNGLLDSDRTEDIAVDKRDVVETGYYSNFGKKPMPSILPFIHGSMHFNFPDHTPGNAGAADNGNDGNGNTPKGFKITIYISYDPNDMKGYVAPSGSQHIGIDVKTLDYTVEFENDPEFANAPASRIVVNQTLDGTKLNLASFKPLSMKLGDREIELPAEHHFVKTVDMRPEINAIAELEFDFDAATGDALWKLRSLDPLTMEDTKYLTDGILPVNDESGRGCGYFTYSVDLKPNLADETEVNAMASIVFDNNEPIETPLWTNITDYTRPEARIMSKETEDGLTFNFVVEGSDKGSGIWLYDLYMKPAGQEKWEAVKTAIDCDTFSYTSEQAVPDADFAVLATDRAGNRQSDAVLNGKLGDADDNGIVDANDAVVIRNYFTGTSGVINKANADVNGDKTIDTQDATHIRNIFLGEQVNNYKRIRLKK